MKTISKINIFKDVSPMLTLETLAILASGNMPEEIAKAHLTNRQYDAFIEFKAMKYPKRMILFPSDRRDIKQIKSMLEHIDSVYHTYYENGMMIYYRLDTEKCLEEFFNSHAY